MADAPGDAPRLLFVHGAASDARIWAPVLAALPQAWQAQALTLSYFGDDDWPDSGARFGTALHAADVARFARRMAGPVHLVGWSYAVHVVLEALIATPSLYASAFLYEPGLGQYIADDATREAYARDAGSLYGAIDGKLANFGAQAAVRQLIGPAFAHLPAEVQAMHLANARTMPLLMGGGQPPTKLARKDLADITVPCRVAVGSRTRPAFALPARALAEVLPSHDLVEVAGADHFLPQSDPVRFAGLVEDWVSIPEC